MPIFTSFSSSSRTAGFFKLPAVTAAVGRLYMWGVNYYGTGNGVGDYSIAGQTLNTPSADLTWTSVTGGGQTPYGYYEYKLFVKSNGTMWAIGYNGNAQMGDGTANTKNTVVQIGSSTNWSKVATGVYHSMAIKTDGTLWATGNNSYGQLGLGNATPTYSWTQVGSSTWTDVVCASYHTLAIKSDGTLWGWGYNSSYGAVGDGTQSNRSSPVQIGNRTDWVKIAAGEYSSMGITADGKLWAWGYYYNLPTNGSNISYGPTQIGSDTNWAEVSLGSWHGLAVKTTGTLWGWSYNNYYGQVGVGNFYQYPYVVQIGSATNWSKISTGTYSSFALNTNGDLYAWGMNNNQDYTGQALYGYSDCYTQNYTKSLGFNNPFQYSYTDSGSYWDCPNSYICDYDGNGFPICYDYSWGCGATYGSGSYYDPQIITYSVTQNCFQGRYPSPVLVASGTGNKFVALQKGFSGFHHAAIRTS